MSSTWNHETKARLSDKVAGNMNDIASLTRQILRGSKSSEVRDNWCDYNTISSFIAQMHSRTVLRFVFLSGSGHMKNDKVENEYMIK